MFGSMNGLGKEYDSDGELVYEGEYLDDERNGYGKKYLDGELYKEGDFVNGDFTGFGIRYDSSSKTEG